MDLKKYKIISVIPIFLLTIILHFCYEICPTFITSIIAPVNESIWEHMKLIYTSFIIYGIFEYLFIRKKTIFNNFLLQLFLVPIIGIISYLIIYLPIFNIFGENLTFSIILLILIIILEEIISFYLLTTNNIKYGKFIGIIGIIIGYLIFKIFTYNPPHNYLFLDNQTNNYGLENKD